MTTRGAVVSPANRLRSATSAVNERRAEVEPPIKSNEEEDKLTTNKSSLRDRMADEEDEPGFDEELDDGTSGVDVGHGRRKRLFSKELRCMMYGFGDDQNPYTESVDILEDLVIEFITEMTHKAMSIGRQGRVQVEDIVFLIRKDPRKFARVKDLLTMNEELKRARKAFDEANYGS
ncbi:transcription initiation factor TFIID subunit 13 isoform X2 [Stegastes partitus]|uniref:Transcription initiation factor TFIID subunit 13 n=1 Tax=Stegastes partitus TaxID=144197 RepID=A0A3B5BFJ0_9TELE|nr:PREDICTED: transcription initiation factor TFIID subunit 13 isoform X2 [Stegastes partitus]